MESSDAAIVQVDGGDDERQIINKNNRCSHINFSHIEHILDFKKPYSKYGAISSNTTPSLSLSTVQTPQTLTVQPLTNYVI